MRSMSQDLVSQHPTRCAQLLTLSDDVANTSVRVLSDTAQAVVFDVCFGPPPPTQLPDYPRETVRIALRRADDRPFAVPIGPNNRRWLHRNERIDDERLHSAVAARVALPWEWLLGSLCLEYDQDPAHLRWSWGDGFDAFIRIVQRHLWFEEYWRRTGVWPVEDVPHEPRLDGRRHPVLTPELMAS